MSQVERQYYLLEALWAAGTAMTGVVYVTFLQSHGLTLLEAGYVNVVFWVLITLFEPITGALADRYGYRLSVMLASTTWGLGLVLYGLSKSMPMFMLSEAILAFGYTCLSGALDAWMVDALHAHKLGHRIRFVMSRRHVVQNITSIIFVLLAGYLGDIDLRLPWIFGGIIVGLLATAYTARVILPVETSPSTRRQIEPLATAAYGSILREGFRTVWQSKILMRNMIATSIFLMAVSAPNMHWQPLFKPQLGDTNAAIGLVSVAMKLTIAFGAYLAGHYWLSTYPRQRTIAMSVVLVSIGVAGSVLPSSTIAALCWFLVHEVGRGVFRPTLDDAIHAETPTGIRATVISVFSMGEKVGGIAGLILFGYVATNVSIETAWLGASGVLLLAAGLYWRAR